MKSNQWKITIAFSTIACFFILWAAINLWTDRVSWTGGRDVAGEYHMQHFVSRSEPAAFWPIVVFKLIVAGMSLLVLLYAHWYWWRRAKQGRAGKTDGGANQSP